MTKALRALFVLALFATAIGTAAAATQASSQSPDPDLKEVSSYRLTMESVNKVDQVTRTMAQELKQDPKMRQRMQVEQELETLNKKEEPTEADQKRIEQLEAQREQMEKDEPALFDNANSLSEMEAAIQKYPPLANALRKNGMAPREYATFMMAMMQAAMAYGFQKSGLKVEDAKLTDVQQANIKFLEEHQAELQKLQEEWKALGKEEK